MEELVADVTVESIYFSHHSAAEVVIEKDFVDFHINS